MEEKSRVCATDRVGYSIILGICALCLGLGVWLGVTESERHGITGSVVALLCMLWCLWKLIDLRYLDGEGITCTRFRRTWRFLAWKDVASVHRVHRHEISLKSSATRVLLVTPVGCPAYEKGKSCNGHLADCKGQAVLLDDSKENRAYIERVWGKIAE